MSDLIRFFNEIHDPSFHTDPLGQAISFSLKSEKEDPLFELALYCKNFVIETLDSWVAYHRSLFCLLFLQKFYKKKECCLNCELSSLIAKGRKKGFGKHFYLQQGYAALIHSFFDQTKQTLDLHQLENGAFLYRDMPDPLQNAEMGLILLYLGGLWNEQSLLKKGLKCAQFCFSLHDPMGQLFEGAWLREKDYRLAHESELFALLFDIASQLSPDFEEVAPFFLKKDYKNPFIFLFKRAFERLFFPTLSLTLALPTIDRSLGCFRYHFGELSALCSIVGKNTGVGSVHKRGLHIVSMGPHYAPLGDPDYYGIFRTSDGKESGLRDLKIHLEEEKGNLRGWTQMYYPKLEKRKTWMRFNIKIEKEKIDLKVRLSDDPSLDTLFYAFFISADRAVIGKESVFYPAALERYEGKVDQVFFKKGGGTLTIFSHFEGEMHLIPLAGKQYFWSANFLLAFPLKQKLFPYHWTVN